MRVLRWIVRALLKLIKWLAAFVVVLIAALAVFLQTDCGREQARKLAEWQLDKAVSHGHAKIDKIEGNLLGDFRVLGVVIEDDDHNPLITVAKLEVDYDLFGLIGKHAEVNRLHIEGLEVAAATDTDGTLNLAALFASASDDDEEEDDEEDEGPPSPPSFTVTVARLEVVGARVSYAAPGQPPRSLTIDRVGGAVRLGEAGLGVTLAGADGRVDPGDGGAPIELALSARAQQHLGGMVSLAGVKLRAGEATAYVPAAGFDADRGLAHGVVRASAARAVIDRFAPDSGIITGADVLAVVSRQGTGERYRIAALALAGDASVDLVATVDPERPAADGVLVARGVDGSTVVRDLPPTAGAATVRFAVSGTDLASASGAATLSGEGEAEGLRATGLEATAILAGGRALFTAAAEVPTGYAWAGGSVDLRATPPVVDARAGGEAGRIEKLWPGHVPARGGASVVATVTGPVDALRASGNVKLRTFRYQDNRIAAGTARFTLTGLPAAPAGKVEFTASGVTVGADRVGRVAGTARIREGGKRIAVSVASKDPTATLSVRANAEIRLDGDHIEVALGDYGLDGHGLEAAGTGGNVSVAGGATRVKAVELHSKAGDLTVEGVVADGRIDLRVVGKRIDLAELSRTLGIEPPLRGIVDIEATLDQRGKKVRANGTIAVRGAGVAGERPSIDGDLTVALEDGVARASGTTRSPQLGRGRLGIAVNAPRDPLDAAGWKALTEAALVHASLTLEGVDLAAVPIDRASRPTSGRANVELDLQAGAALGSLTVTATNVGVPQVPGRFAPRLVVALSGGRIDATVDATTSAGERARVQVIARAPGPLADVDAWVAAGRQVFERGEVRAGPISFERLALLGAPPARAEGSVRVSATVGPALANADSEVVVATKKPSGRTVETSIRLGSRHTDHRLEGDLTVLIGGAPYVVGTASLAAGMAELEAGHVDAMRSARLIADLTATTLPLHLVGDLIESDERLVGALSGTASVRGSMDRPVVLATVRGDGAGTTRVRFERLLAGFRLAKQRLVLELVGEQRKGGVLEVDVSAGLAPRANDLTASVVAQKFDLGFLRGVLPELGISGTLESDVRVSGTVERPVVAGTASIAGGRVRPGPPLRVIDDVAAKVVLSPTEVTLHATGKAGQGNLEVDARAGMTDLEPSDVKLTLSMVDLPVETGGQLISIATETTVAGQRRGQVWDLTVDIGDTAVGLPERDTRYLHELGSMDDVVFVEGGNAAELRRRARERARKPARPHEPSGVKVRIRAPATISVRGQEARAIVSVDLRYDDTGPRTEILGTARTESGWIRLFGRRYQIERAIASFSGDPNPGLDVRLVHEFSRMTLYVDVIGSGEKPELRLSSDPAIYDDAQLLSFVLGASPDEAQDRERTLSGRAVGIASSLVADQVQSLVRDVLPIDVLRIELADDSSNPERMTVGKWLSNKLFVAYRHRFEADDSENAGEAVLEWRFLPRWLLEAFFGDRSVGGADVLWIKRF